MMGITLPDVVGTLTRSFLNLACYSLTKVGARFCSFGTIGESAKHAYAPSPTAHIAFFLQARPTGKTLICSSMETVPLTFL
jgi:hypothetical protein